MTRINTNVSSLVAQNTLGRSNASLNQALTRLSTGLRINTGKDDPAGLIASENLRSDITSIKRAISNTDRANQVIATADSALGQVSSLLNDIRGLVTESANSGALSDEQIAANQLQIDSSLEALNRIAQTTTFQGRRLLDGSLNFITSAGANFGELSNLQIDQANLGATGSVSVDVSVTTAATKASVNVTNIAPAVAGANSTGSLTFSDGNVAASGTVNLPVETSAAAAGTGNVVFTVESVNSTQSVSTVALATDTLTITAIDNGSAEGNTTYTIVVNDVNTTPNGATASYNETTDVLTIDADISGGVGSDDVAAAIALAEDSNGDLVFTASSNGTTNLVAGDEAAIEAIVVGNSVAGVNATTVNRTIAITTNAAADQDFDLQILLDSSANITPNDADSGDGILASITGNAATGYTITIANDATVDLDNLATFIQTNIDEVATATINGNPAHDFNAATQALAVPPAAPISVTGSQAQVTNTQAITINALQSAGANGNFNLSFVTGTVVGTGTLAQRVVVTGDAQAGYVVTIDDSETVTFGDISDALETIAEVGAGGSATATPATVFDTTSFNPSVGNTTLTGGRTAGDDVITITADSQDAAFDGTITFNTGNATLGGITVTETNGDITISVDSTSTYQLSAIRDAINSQLTGYTATLAGTGSGTFDGNNVNDNTAPIVANLAGGLAPSGGLAADAVIQLTGALGSEVFNLKAGTDIATLVQQINLVSDATGVEATANGTTLQVQSTVYGSNAVVELKVNSEGTGGTFTASLGSGARATGADVVATVNGIAATGNGNQLSINTATLDLATSVEEGFTGTASFTITGGGALFQLGPDVVSNQQARLGITSVNTSSLGGVSGKLYQLGTGGTASLTSGNLDTTAAIVDEAINQITSLRGRLGAFQRTTLETNKQALNDTLVNLTDAESSIRDADFASETAALTRAQILVQSGTTVLQISNSNPQNVLALLRG